MKFSSSSLKIRRATLSSRHRQRTELLKIHSKPRIYHPPRDDRTHPRTFPLRKILTWPQTGPTTIKVSCDNLLTLVQSDLLTEESITAENEKENDSRSGPTTQAMIQRRRRPKRRSTGVVHVDMEVSPSLQMSRSPNLNCLSFRQDIDPDRQESPVDNGDDKDMVSKNRKARKL